MNTKIKSRVLTCFILVALLSLSLLALFSSPPIAEADTMYSESDLNFTLFTNASSEQEYKVSIKTSSRSTAVRIIVPDTHLGLPVTQVADNGFTACSKLTVVVLPISVIKIGNNAFFNCSKLVRLTMPAVEIIGSNAFAMCPLLEDLFVPESTVQVGSQMLRSNPNTLFVASTAAEASNWASTWDSSFTGNVVWGAEASDILKHREILEDGEVVAYEIPNDQLFGDISGALTIYSSYSPDPANVPYKPVINICPQAFSFSALDKLTIEYINGDDHSINMQSEAFAFSVIVEIEIDVDITLNHAEDLVVAGTSLFPDETGGIIRGDEYDNSIDVFNFCCASSITLRDSLTVIPDRMFKDCPLLVNFKLFEEDYEGENRLPAVTRIGTNAFWGCNVMENIYIRNDVAILGDNIFEAWGGNTGNPNPSIVFEEMYEDQVPTSVFSGTYLEGVSISFKQPISVVVHFQDGLGTQEVLLVKPGEELPEMDAPTLNGFIFLGFFADADVQTTPYYNQAMEPQVDWSEDYEPVMYAHWQSNTYTVIYDSNVPENASGTVSGTMADSTFTFGASNDLDTNSYSLTGWSFDGWEDADGNQYTDDESVDTLVSERGQSITLYARWTPISYAIAYNANRPDNATAQVVGTMQNNTVSYENSIQLRANSFSLVGWVFQGWEDANGNLYTNGQYVSNLSTADGSTVTLYVQWIPSTYIVAYSSNVSEAASSTISGTMDSTTFYYDTAANLRTNAFTRTGWTFGGWNTESDGSGQDYDDEDIVENLAVSGTVTLYAQWSRISYTVRYNSNKPDNASNDVEGTMADSLFYFDASTTLRNNTFSLVGWSFEGWEDVNGNSYGNLHEDVNYSSSSGAIVVLYAQWKAAEYEIQYNPNKPANAAGDVVGEMDNSEHDFDTEALLSENAFSLVGWEFVEWNTAADGSGDTFSDGEEILNLAQSGTIVMYAQWNALYFDVTDSITNATISGELTGLFVDDYSTTISADTGYNLPETLTVTIDDESYTDFSYNSATGAFAIVAEDIVGDIVISGEATPMTFSVTNSIDNTTLDTEGSTAATYGANYTSTITANTGYDLPETITVTVGGEEIDDFTYIDGEISISGDLITGNVVISGEAVSQTYSVTGNFSYASLSTSSPNYATRGSSYTGAVTASTGYNRPGTITVTIGGTSISNFTYNSSTGAVTIPGSQVTGAIVISGTATRKTYTVTDNLSNAYLSPSGSNQATHGIQYSGTITAYTGYDRPSSITVRVGGTTISNYTYSGGTVTIPAASVTGAIAISGTGYEKSYTVSYRPGTYGSGSNDSDTKYYFDNLTLPGVMYTRTGYTQTGWASNAAGTTWAYDLGATYSSNSGRTLYPYWEIDYYTIAYRAGTYGSGTSQNQYKEYGETVTLYGALFTRTGYTQTGWATNAAGTTRAYDLGATYSSNSARTLYPYWDEVRYDISYVLNGGTNHGSNPTTYAQGDSFTLSTPTRSGYTFGGWYSNSALTSPKSGISSTDIGAKTFYAKWTAIPSNHSVYFEENNYVTFIPDPDYNTMVLGGGYEGFTTIVPHGGYVNIEYSAKVASSGIRITVNGSIYSSASIRVMGDTTVSAIYVGTNSISNMSLIITEEIVDGEITWTVDVEEE